MYPVNAVTSPLICARLRLIDVSPGMDAFRSNQLGTVSAPKSDPAAELFLM